MSARFSLCLAALLPLLGGAALADGCPPNTVGHTPPPFAATIVTSGPFLSGVPCGATDCATALVAGISGGKPDARTVAENNIPTATHMLWTGTRFYVEGGGQWHDAGTLKQGALPGAVPASASLTCKAAGEGVVNGEAAAIYTIHAEVTGLSMDSTAWISKASGLTLKEMHRFKGGRLTVTTFDYAKP